jgi:hypothetical protein
MRIFLSRDRVQVLGKRTVNKRTTTQFHPIFIFFYRLEEACSTSSNAAAPIPVPTLTREKATNHGENREMEFSIHYRM